MMVHKGYIGKVEFDDEAGVFHGEVVNTRDFITFQGPPSANQFGGDPFGQEPQRVGPGATRVGDRAHRSGQRPKEKTAAQRHKKATTIAAVFAGTRLTTCHARRAP